MNTENDIIEALQETTVTMAMLIADCELYKNTLVSLLKTESLLKTKLAIINETNKNGKRLQGEVAGLKIAISIIEKLEISKDDNFAHCKLSLIEWQKYLTLQSKTFCLR